MREHAYCQRLWGKTGPRRKAGSDCVFLGNIIKNKQINIWGDGAVIRDYIYVKDIVDACLKAIASIQNEYHVFNIGSGIGTSLNELIEIIGKIIQKEVKVKFTKGRNIDTPIDILDATRAQKSS